MSLALFYLVIIIIGGTITGFFITRVRIWKPKRTLVFSAVYFGCGLLAFVYLMFMSGDIAKAPSKEFLQEQRIGNEQLSSDLKLRKYESLKEEHLKFTKTFEATVENIEILRNENSYYLPVYISWAETNENEITVSYYETPLYLNGVYITPFVEEPRIEWNDNKLYIIEADTMVTVKSVHFSSQLLNIGFPSRNDDPLYNLIGQRILHLNVPKQFNIIDKDGWY